MTATTPGFGDLIRVFGRIGLLSFGGPAGQIALMHRELVEQRGWIAEADYLRALNFCHLLPGPEAQQLATYIGWRLHGLSGGLAAGLLFILPGAALMMALAMLYAVAADLEWVAALFLGIKAAVLAIVVQALIGIGRRALDRPAKRVLAVAAFVALFLFDAPFPLVVLVAGLIGLMAPASLGGHVGSAAEPPPAARPWRQSLGAVAGFGLLWAAPMLLILLALGPGHVLWQVGLFFSKLAVVTFGGAYAVLAYMAQAAVQTYGWLQPGEMADGLGLAETTPGPLILVTQFVGFLAAFRDPAPFAPLMAGVLAGLLTLWVTFVPCFLWIFALAPWIERLNRLARLQSALAGVTAAVVGVIANLTLWFALHILFSDVDERTTGPLRLYIADPASFAPGVAVIALLAAVLLFRLKLDLIKVLVIAMVAGLVLSRFV